MKKTLLFALTLFIIAIGMFVSCDNKEYIVTFDTDGAGEIAPQTIKSGEKATVPIEPKKDDYTFIGWYFCNYEWDFSDHPVTKDITLTAVWSYNFASTNTIALPETTYAFVGQPITIYYQNIISVSSLDGLAINVSANGKGIVYDDRWTYTPTQAETIIFKISVANANGIITDAGCFTIEVKDTSKKQDLSVLVIGDSTITHKTETKTLLTLASGEGYNLSLLGTLGTSGSTNRHEGRGGWKAETYCTKESTTNGTIPNPFYNPLAEGESKFDFAYYMSNQGYNSVDCVVIQLGINDVFSPKSDSGLNSAAKKYLKYMQYMIDSVHEYNPNIKIVINLILPCSYKQEYFDIAYPGTSSERCKINSYKTNLGILETFSELNNVYIFQSNSVISRENYRDHVHPTNDGYAEIGTQLYSFIRAIN